MEVFRVESREETSYLLHHIFQHEPFAEMLQASNNLEGRYTLCVDLRHRTCGNARSIFPWQDEAHHLPVFTRS